MMVARRRWTFYDCQYLSRMVDHGLTWREIALRLETTVGAAQALARRSGILGPRRRLSAQAAADALGLSVDALGRFTRDRLLQCVSSTSVSGVVYRRYTVQSLIESMYRHPVIAYSARPEAASDRLRWHIIDARRRHGLVSLEEAAVRLDVCYPSLSRAVRAHPWLVACRTVTGRTYLRASDVMTILRCREIVPEQSPERWIEMAMRPAEVGHGDGQRH